MSIVQNDFTYMHKFRLYNKNSPGKSSCVFEDPDPQPLAVVIIVGCMRGHLSIWELVRQPAWPTYT